MSLTAGTPRDVLRARQRAVVERRRAHREAVLSTSVDWRPFHVTPATVHVDGEPRGWERPSSHCVQLDDGSWALRERFAEDAATP